jgi:hypothetical protein
MDRRRAGELMDLLGLGTGFFLGLRHSFDPDHVAAVAQFASADPRPARGLAFGLRWGAGHALAVLLLGAALVPAGLPLGPAYERAGELLVGVLLIGLAIWRLLALRFEEHEHVHCHADGVVHAHPHHHALGHVHTHAPTFTGFVHGSAGVLGVLAILPLGSAGPAQRAFRLVAFSAGSLISMGVFGALAGRVYEASARHRRALRWATGVTALAGLALGVLWIVRNA